MRFGPRHGFAALLSLALIGAAPGAAPRAQTSPTAPGKPADPQGASTPSSADAVKRLKDVIGGMGLKIESSQDNTVSVESKGNTYEFVVSDDGAIVFINVWWTIPKDKVAKMPWEKMLTWNTTHDSYFGMQRNDDGSALATMSVNFAAKGIDAAVVRDRLDEIEQDSDDETEMFDTTKWK